MNNTLNNISNGMEIKGFVLKMGKLKVHGHNDFQGVFFQTLWNIVGAESVR